MSAPHDGSVGDARKRRDESAPREAHDQPHDQDNREHAHPTEHGRDDQPLGALGHPDQSVHGASVGPASSGGLDFDAIRARLAAATPGPWEAHCDDDMDDPTIVAPSLRDPHEDRPRYVAQTAYDNLSRTTLNSAADAAFIAHARTDIPLLLAALDEARAEVVAQATRIEDCPACSEAALLIRATAAESARDAAEGAIERVLALADEWETATCITDGAPCSFHRHASGYAGDLRAALAPVTTDETEGGA